MKGGTVISRLAIGTTCPATVADDARPAEAVTVHSSSDGRPISIDGN